MLTLVGMKWYSIILFVFAIAFVACKKTNNPPSKPEIAFLELSQNTVRNGHPKDTVNILLRYTINGSKLKIKDDPINSTIYYIDSRFDTTITEIPFPADIEVRKDEEDKTISGSITLSFEASRHLVMRPDRPDGDTLRYEIYMKDIEGTESNRVKTDNIFIIP